jgi:hypothetical protein
MSGPLQGLSESATGVDTSAPQLLFPPRVSILNRELRSEERHMKRVIAGVLLLVGMGVAPAVAWDGDRGLHRDIRHDEARIAHDRRELRRDLYYGNYRAARQERRELRHEYRDVNRDRRELGWR